MILDVPGHQVLDHLQMVGDTLQKGFVKQRRAGRFQARLFQGPQATNQIAVIHCRQEKRRERLESECIVPIIKTSFEFGHALDRVAGPLDVGGKFGQSRPTEVQGSKPGVQQQTKIGGGYAMCHQLFVFVDDVGNQPVLSRVAKLAKEAPRLQRDAAQHGAAFFIQFVAAHRRGQV